MTDQRHPLDWVIDLNHLFFANAEYVMELALASEEGSETSLRFDFELEAIRTHEDRHMTIEAWVEKEKQRLWLGYYSSKV